MRLNIAGEAIDLYADRALYWPARNRLCIADLHLGKDEVFRRAGIAVPRGDAAADLARLDGLIQRSGADTLWILGDLIHARLPQGDWQAPWREFLSRHAHMRIAVVEGNHDRALAETGLPVERLPACVVDGPFAFQHAPTPHPNTHVIAGHLHPAHRMRGLGRIPMFWLRPGITVLPAFSFFTGAYVPERTNGERRILCDGESLFDLDAYAQNQQQ
jgi:DNA ligase-associated metallophosphoesterase